MLLATAGAHTAHKREAASPASPIWYGIIVSRFDCPKRIKSQMVQPPEKLPPRLEKRVPVA